MEGTADLDWQTDHYLKLLVVDVKCDDYRSPYIRRAQTNKGPHRLRNFPLQLVSKLCSRDVCGNSDVSSTGAAGLRCSGSYCSLLPDTAAYYHDPRDRLQAAVRISSSLVRRARNPQPNLPASLRISLGV